MVTLQSHSIFTYETCQKTIQYYSHPEYSKMINRLLSHAPESRQCMKPGNLVACKRVPLVSKFLLSRVKVGQCGTVLWEPDVRLWRDQIWVKNTSRSQWPYASCTAVDQLLLGNHPKDPIGVTIQVEEVCMHFCTNKYRRLGVCASLDRLVLQLSLGTPNQTVNAWCCRYLIKL